MKADELIDDVARQMTATAARPMLRARVMAAIGEARQEPTRGWRLPVAASATVAALALAWFMLPSPPVANETPIARQAAPIATGPMDVDSAAALETAQATPVPAATQRVRAVEEVAVIAWPDDAPAVFPTLPPLSRPQPIVIEPITWDDVAIAPIALTLIEVRTLSIEPLAPARDSGA